jgi:hypothetical protein
MTRLGLEPSDPYCKAGLLDGFNDVIDIFVGIGISSATVRPDAERTVQA